MTAPLANLGYWSGGVTPDQANSATGQAFLKALQQYDPSASFVSVPGGMASDNNTVIPASEALSYNPSKLPGVLVPGASWGGAGGASLGPNVVAGAGGGWSPAWQNVTSGMMLANPQAVTNSPIYGNITANGNIQQDNSGLLGTLGQIAPYAVMSILGGGLGMAGASMLSGLAPTLGSAVTSALGNVGGNFALNEIMSGGNARFNPLSLGGVASAALGLPSWVPTAANTVAGLAQGKTPVLNPYALAARFAPFLFGGGGGG